MVLVLIDSLLLCVSWFNLLLSRISYHRALRWDRYRRRATIVNTDNNNNNNNNGVYINNTILY